MTENSPTNIESLSLEVEQARLDIELIRQSNDDHRVSLERWNTALRPIHEKYIQSRAQSVAFATLGIRSMFLLNGGALLVFPAFAKLLGTGFVEQMGWAQWSIGCFVVGLITIALTTVLAYLSSDLRSMALEYESSRTHLFLLRSQVLAKSEEEPYPEQEIAALSGTRTRRTGGLPALPRRLSGRNPVACCLRFGCRDGE